MATTSFLWRPEDISKTAFKTRYEQYEIKVLPLWPLQCPSHLPMGHG